MQVQLTTTQWLALPAEVKEQLKNTFGIRRSSGSRVEDNRVISDGYEHRDLAVITPEAMQAFLGIQDSTDDFYSLFDQVLDILYANIQEAKDVESQPAPSTPIVPEFVFTFNGKMFRAVEMIAGPDPQSVPTLYPTAPQEAADKAAKAKAEVKPKVTRAPRKKAKK